MLNLCNDGVDNDCNVDHCDLNDEDYECIIMMMMMPATDNVE